MYKTCFITFLIANIKIVFFTFSLKLFLFGCTSKVRTAFALLKRKSCCQVVNEIVKSSKIF